MELRALAISLPTPPPLTYVSAPASLHLLASASSLALLGAPGEPDL